jgi:hypothetical protein
LRSHGVFVERILAQHPVSIRASWGGPILSFASKRNKEDKDQKYPNSADGFMIDIFIRLH